MAPVPPLLEVRHLTTRLALDQGELLAVDDVSFALAPGSSTGLVGESGSGKSMLALSLLRLLPPAARILQGEVLLGSRDLVALPERELRAVRGRRLAMVFQDPASALNPVLRVGDQIEEAIRLHRGASAAEARAEAIAALAAVQLADPERRIDSYPHQLSGGMRQRAMIAMALACHAELLIADEPTTALDTTVQAQVLDLLARLRRERAMALLLISHDLRVVTRVCETVLVMYAGQLIESLPAADVFERAAHPYTRALLRSRPTLRADSGPRRRLPTISGSPPDPTAPLRGCRFAPRCDRAGPECFAARPPTVALGASHRVACLHPMAPGERAEAAAREEAGR